MDVDADEPPLLLAMLERALSGRLAGASAVSVVAARDVAVRLGLEHAGRVLEEELRHRRVTVTSPSLQLCSRLPDDDALALLRSMDQLLEGALWRVSDEDAVALREAARRLGLRYTTTLMTVELLQRRAYNQGLNPQGRKPATLTSRPLSPVAIRSDVLRHLMYVVTTAGDEDLSELDGLDLPRLRSGVLRLLSRLDQEMMRRGLEPEMPNVAGLMLWSEGS